MEAAKDQLLLLYWKTSRGVTDILTYLWVIERVVILIVDTSADNCCLLYSKICGKDTPC